jgi:hypothetical protein
MALDVVGNTLMLDIRYRYNDDGRMIFARFEQVNLTGCIEDRMAPYIFTIRIGSLKMPVFH